MAVCQTREHLLDRLGYLTDNPAIGPLLEEYYWRPGNSITHDATLTGLTGEGLSGRSLARVCNMSVEDACEGERERMRAATETHVTASEGRSLDATIRVVHGAETVADNSDSNERMCADFERWVEARYPTR
jgi:hypothetical protein